jgi:threonine/homoserine/homoserine lactone efflux protein
MTIEVILIIVFVCLLIIFLFKKLFKLLMFLVAIALLYLGYKYLIQKSAKNAFNQMNSISNIYYTI